VSATGSFCLRPGISHRFNQPHPQDEQQIDGHHPDDGDRAEEKLVTAISRRLTGAPAKNTSVLGVRSRATNGIPHSHTATGTKGNNGLKPTAFPVSPSTSTDRALAKPNSIS